MTTAITMETGTGAPGLHRRYILEAIRKRLSERLSTTSSISDDECGDIKRIRLETTLEKTNNDVGKTTSWNSAQTAATNCLTKFHCAGNSVYQQLVGTALSRDHATTTAQCCQPMTSLSVDKLLAKDVSSLCDVTVAAAACSLLQAVGRIHCRDCLQLKTSQLPHNEDATVSSAVSRPISSIPTSLTACNSHIQSAPVNNSVILAKSNIPVRELNVQTGSTNKCHGNTTTQPTMITSGVPSLPVAASTLQPRLLLTPRAPLMTSPLNPHGIIGKPLLPCITAHNRPVDVINQSGVVRLPVVTATTTVTSSSTRAFNVSPPTENDPNILTARTSSSSSSSTAAAAAAPPTSTVTETPVDYSTARRMRIESMTVARLRTECRRLRLPITGPKPNLVRRLAQNADAFKDDTSLTTLTVPASLITSCSAIRPFQTVAPVSGSPSCLNSINRMTLLEAISRLRPGVNLMTRCQSAQNVAQQNVVSSLNNGLKTPVWSKGLTDDVTLLTNGIDDKRQDQQPASDINLVDSAAATCHPSSSVNGSALGQTQDPEQLSLWQCQQKLIEELRRQLEHSRRAIVEARQQKQESPITALSDVITPSTTDEAADQEPRDSKQWSAESISTKEYLSIDDVNCVYNSEEFMSSDTQRRENEHEETKNKNDTYNDIIDLLSECQQTGQLLDVDDWTDNISLEWNQNEAANDVTDTDRTPRSFEPLEVGNTKPRKQLTIDVNAGQPDAGYSSELVWTNSPPDMGSCAASGPQWSWWEWDDFLTPDSNLSETPRTDSSSSSLCWDSEGTTFSPPPSHAAERHLANATESASYARRDLLLSMSAARHLATGH